MTKKELRALLMDCAEKLNLYRSQHSGEYVGGVEYTELQRRIVKALDDIPTVEPSERHRGDEIDPKLAQQAWYHVQQEAVVNGDLPLKDAIVNIWTRITGIPSSLNRNER